jgi:hypothetical protein
MKSFLFLLTLSSAAAFSPTTTKAARVPLRMSAEFNSDEELINNNFHVVKPDAAGSTKNTSLWEESKGKFKSVIDVVNEKGLALKPKATQASILARATVKKPQQLKHLLQATAYYTLFMLYRAYRGLFVILPEVYRQIYDNMSGVVDYPFDDDVVANDINPETGKLRWRTKVNVAVLSTVLVVCYTVEGGLNVLSSFIKTALSSKSVTDSFAAAVKKQEETEERISRLSKVNGAKK